jgi:hypothetical protein
LVTAIAICLIVGLVLAAWDGASTSDSRGSERWPSAWQNVRSSFATTWRGRAPALIVFKSAAVVAMCSLR